jgi:hypothetical protein
VDEQSTGRMRRLRGWTTGLFGLALVAALGGCAGSPTPLPDLAAATARVLSPAEQKQAVAEIEQRKNAAAEASKQISSERVTR